MNPYRRTKLFGVGINDSDYNTQPYVDGKRVKCPFYSRWHCMLNRCYNELTLAKRPTYKDCTVCEEWLTFSNFKRWMAHQDWKGKDLDKDLLVTGNKVYSPETCVFVDRVVNNFLTDSAAARGNFPLGVYYNTYSRKFLAKVKNPFTKKQEHLGLFTCPNLAHLVWRKHKLKLALKLAATQSDHRVALALVERYRMG